MAVVVGRFQQAISVGFPAASSTLKAARDYVGTTGVGGSVPGARRWKSWLLTCQTCGKTAISHHARHTSRVTKRSRAARLLKAVV